MSPLIKGHIAISIFLIAGLSGHPIITAEVAAVGFIVGMYGMSMAHHGIRWTKMKANDCFRRSPTHWSATPFRFPGLVVILIIGVEL